MERRKDEPTQIPIKKLLPGAEYRKTSEAVYGFSTCLRAGPVVAYFWPEVDMKKCLIFFWKRISWAG